MKKRPIIRATTTALISMLISLGLTVLVFVENISKLEQDVEKHTKLATFSDRN